MRNRGEEYYRQKRHKRKKKITYRTAIIIVLITAICAVALYFTRKVVVSAAERVEESDSTAILNDADYVYCHRDSQKAYPLLSRRRYREVLHDQNDVQLVAAKRNGIKDTLTSRISDYEKLGLVKIVPNEYYAISELSHSVPYLVPKARILANTIGKYFQDMVSEKYHGSVYKIRITSMLRTRNDINHLRRRNRWATENSCHQYGTTIDISYSNYEYVSGPQVGAYELTELLAQTLYELREQKLCYVLYERRNCFHLTLNEMNLGSCTVAPEHRETKIPEMKPPKKTKPYIPHAPRKKPDTGKQKIPSSFDDKPSPLI